VSNLKKVNRIATSPGNCLLKLASKTDALLSFAPSANAQSDARGKKENQSFTLVELFTSEGCRNCPSADENLAKITEAADGKKLPIYTLSFQLDYWNYIGWNDP